MNTADAYEVCALDDEVDNMNRDMYHIIEDLAQKKPERINMLLHYLGITRDLERIADSATNIAEDIIYLIDGDIVRHNVEDYSNNLK